MYFKLSQTLPEEPRWAEQYRAFWNQRLDVPGDLLKNDEKRYYGITVAFYKPERYL